MHIGIGTICAILFILLLIAIFVGLSIAVKYRNTKNKYNRIDTQFTGLTTQIAQEEALKKEVEKRRRVTQKTKNAVLERDDKVCQICGISYNFVEELCTGLGDYLLFEIDHIQSVAAMGIDVGIDLGTTFSAVAKINENTGKPEVIKNSFDSPITPSVLCFEPNGDILFGEDAKNMQGMGNTNAIAFFKRNMGNDLFSVEILGKTYSATDLSAIFLSKFVKEAEACSGDKIFILESDYEVNNKCHSGYATTEGAIRDADFDAKKLSEGLQIKPYLDETAEEISETASYRTQVTEYTVSGDLDVAWSEETLANPQYGDGGMPQYFVKNIETEIDNGTLVRGTSYSLNNSEITNTDYYKMVGEAKMKYAGGLE